MFRSDVPTIIEVNHNLSLEEMFEESKCNKGNLDYVLRHFSSVDGVGVDKLEAVLFFSERSVRTDQVLQCIRKGDLVNPWREARIEHLLAFHSRCPLMCQQVMIVALGSVVGGSIRGVPCLLGDDSFEGILPITLDDENGWEPPYSFLAVRNLKVM